MRRALKIGSTVLAALVLLAWAGSVAIRDRPSTEAEVLARVVGSSAPGSPGSPGSSPSDVPSDPAAAPGATPTTPAPPTDPAATAEQQRWVDSTLAGMSLDQRVGQLFMGYAYGTTAADPDPVAVAGNQRVYGVDTAAEAVRRHGLGGVVYFDAGGPGAGSLPDNVVDPAQLRQLSTDLRAAGGELSPLVAADQEQGTVVRVRDGVTLLPGQMAQGADGRTDDVRDAARVTGSDLLALGIDVNFAPDADVNVAPANPVIGERSFGDDPAAVARLTAAAVEGYRAAGVAAAAKHFPGHGSTTVDSHLGLPEVTQAREQLDAVDLAPFRAAIDADVPMIMVGHLLVPALDPAEPASLSPSVVGGLLRDELGFDGVIVTDALNMAAVADRYPPGEVAVRALLAGNDLLLMPPRFVEARDAVLAAVRDGRIPAGRVDDSVRRLLRLKWQLAHASPRPPTPPVDPGAVASRIASRSVTLIDMACGALPLTAGTTVEVAGSSRAAQMLRDELAARGLAPPPAPLLSGLGSEPAAVRIELGRSNWTSGATARPRRIAVSTGAPYQPPDGGTAAWLATYSTDAASTASLAAILTGQAAPAGRLPVATLGGADRPPSPRGTGLSSLVTCQAHG